MPIPSRLKLFLSFAFSYLFTKVFLPFFILKVHHTLLPHVLSLPLQLWLLSWGSTRWCKRVFKINLDYISYHFCLRCCPFNQFCRKNYKNYTYIMLVSIEFKHYICPMYIFSFDSNHDGYNTLGTRIPQFVFVIYYLDRCRKKNVIRVFHFINTPLFNINISS
jgi:hypothetical protein